jgi:hypothetical protein
MSICNFTTTINGTDNVGSSRITINNNFSKLDTAACTLSTAVSGLQTQINSGVLRGTPGLSGVSFFAPVGTVVMFAGTTNTALTADRWLLCDGTRRLVAGSINYTSLADTIGRDPLDTSFFYVPNLNNKLVVGTDINTPVGTTSTILFPAGTTNTLSYLNLQYYIKY